jgi:hypothetical protein
MLDDMAVLHDAAEGYRAATTAAGIAWPDPVDPPGGPPPDLVYRLFDVDHVAEQVTWLHSLGWESQPLLPEGGGLMPWPTDVGESLGYLHFAVGTPFPWRHQLPLFFFGNIMYAFVLKGDHEGEIWRYEYDPDTWGSVRAATSLAALFAEWTRGIAAGVVAPGQRVRWLQVGDGVNDPFEVLLERAPDLDPFAFPVDISHRRLLRARQRDCGVDMDCIDRGFECYEELLNTIDAIETSLGGRSARRHGRSA